MLRLLSAFKYISRKALQRVKREATIRRYTIRFWGCTVFAGKGVRVRFWQRPHILVNEAVARAGRGQAIAPTMLRAGCHVAHSRGDGLSSPIGIKLRANRVPPRAIE